MSPAPNRDYMELDLTNYHDTTGARVDPGHYRVQVEDAVQGKSSRTQNDMITLSLRVVGTAFDGDSIVDRLVNTESSKFRWVAFMQAIGLPTPKAKIRINPRAFVGKYLEVDADDADAYMGKIKSQVMAYYQIATTPAAAAADLEDMAMEGLDDDEPGLGEIEEPEAELEPAATQAMGNEDDDEEVSLEEVPF